MRMRLALALFSTLSCLAVEAPGWLKELGQSSLPAYAAKVSAVVLINEESTTVEASGRRLRTTRYAVKILNKEGARHASQGDIYYTDTGKVRDIKGWLIMPSGKVKEYGKTEIVERGAGSGLYEQAKVRLIDASRDSDPGAVFGFESTIEEKSVFNQYIFDFQNDLPSLRSSMVLNLPPDWKAEGKVFRGLEAQSITAEVNGASYRWQLVNLPPFELEPGAPRRSTQNARLVVTAYPPGGAGTTRFETWRDVSVWGSKVSDPSTTITPALQAEAEKLTTGAATQWDKLKALSEHAQRIRYESIQLNLSRGGGYTPRPAATIMAKGYGDCKDKANYLRTLLKAIGVESYPVMIYSGDPRRARKEWPSPMQFNHAVLAIRIPDDTKTPAAFNFPGIGKLLLFDPTDESVPFGYLPDHEQDSFALLAAGDKGDLFKTPATSSAVNHLARKSQLKVSEEGNLTASITQIATGQEAFDSHYLLKNQSLPEYVKMVERRYSRAAAGAKLSKVEPKDDTAANQFSLSVDFTATGYAKNMAGRLLMVRPIVMNYLGLPNVTDAKRTQPLIISPASFQESIELELPKGFAVDEMPESGAIETEFGRYKVSYRNEGNKVFVERELELQSAWMPVEGFKAARDFFSKIGGTEQSPIVLVRK